ncbi:MAG: DUF6507 family protein [Microbacterium enclense]
MRYSVDATGVAAVMSDVAACFDDVIAAVTQTLTAADDAAAALRADASGVLRALEAVFSPRRQSGPGIAAYAGEAARRLQDATIAFVTGDDEMAVQTNVVAQGTLPVTRRGFGAVAF